MPTMLGDELSMGQYTLSLPQGVGVDDAKPILGNESRRCVHKRHNQPTHYQSYTHHTPAPGALVVELSLLWQLCIVPEASAALH